MAVGAVTGGVLGGATGLVGAPALFVATLFEAQAASGCGGEECEGFGLALFFYTLPIAAFGCVAGMSIGAVGGAWIASAIADGVTSTRADGDAE